MTITRSEYGLGFVTTYGILSYGIFQHQKHHTWRQTRSRRSSSYATSGNSFDTSRQADKNMPSDIFLVVSSAIKAQLLAWLVTVHDICLVNGSHPFSPARLGIMKSITRNSFRCIPCDEFDGLHYTVDDLKLINQISVRDRGCQNQLTSCSIPEYSPSVFSRIRTVFTSS